MSLRVAVFLDYQNVHMTAHGLFLPYGAEVHEALVHPLRLAERLVSKRRDGGELVSVRVFRGRPNRAASRCRPRRTMPRPPRGNVRILGCGSPAEI